MKALELLKNSKTVAERAESFVKTAKRTVEREVIDTIQDRVEKLQQRLFDLKDFTLDTNLNKGMVRMTSEECSTRFKDIIQTEFELALAQQEAKIKQASFDDLFNDDAVVDAGSIMGTTTKAGSITGTKKK